MEPDSSLAMASLNEIQNDSTCSRGDKVEKEKGNDEKAHVFADDLKRKDAPKTQNRKSNRNNPPENPAKIKG